MKYTQITVITTTFGSDIVACLMYDLGSEGVSIVDKNDVLAVLNDKKTWDYVDDSLKNITDERVYVNGFFSCVPDGLYQGLEEIKQNAVQSVGSLEVSVSDLDSADYENEWKKYYKPIHIKNVVIKPCWINENFDDKVEVLLDPGLAFGTGNHETTSLCIDLMQDIDLHDKRVADIGCGSGILGITATKLGADTCVFTDIDDQAITATKNNIKLNKTNSKSIVKQEDLMNDEQGFDVCIANITADILIRLSDRLPKLLKTNGTCIISGIIHSRAEEVFNAFSKTLTHVKTVKKGEWEAMEWKKNA